MFTFKAKALVLAAVAAMVMGIVGCGSSGKKSDTPPAGGDTTGATAAAADTGTGTASK